MLRRYLDRIGIEPEIATAMEAGNRKPSEENLGLLLRAHLLAVPFENLSQHVHPSGGEGVPGIPVTALPTLDVSVSLSKIVDHRRGGFCWEINTCFGWLLTRLGYSVRYGLSHVVTPNGPVPGHVCLFVDGLRSDCALHVDPGFGDAPRTPIPAVFDEVNADPMIGDEYVFVTNDASQHSELKESPAQSDRFGTVLMRRRTGASPNADLHASPDGQAPPPGDDDDPTADLEPVYLLNFGDDLSLGCDEFREGLAYVLRDVPSNLFASKRFCVILRETGFAYVGSTYRKEVRGGTEVQRESIGSEAAYRDALEAVAGIKLGS
jgi:arylamine N-acetyltransferase